MFTTTEADNTWNSRKPRNRGKVTGPKTPLQARHIWAIRTRLKLADRTRDLVLFNLAIDSKLRGCDIVSLKVGDAAPHGYAIDRAMVCQRKTGRRSSSKSQSRPARRSTHTSRLVARNLEISYSLAAGVQTTALQRESMHAYFRSGSPV
jgi:hypothetical protein